MREIDWGSMTTPGDVSVERWATTVLTDLWIAIQSLDTWQREPEDDPVRREIIAFQARRIVRNRESLRVALDVTDEELTVLAELTEVLGVRNAYRALIGARYASGSAVTPTTCSDDGGATV